MCLIVTYFVLLILSKIEKKNLKTSHTLFVSSPPCLNSEYCVDVRHTVVLIAIRIGSVYVSLPSEPMTQNV